MTLSELDNLCAQSEANPPHFIVLRIPLAMLKTPWVQGERLLVFSAANDAPAVFGRIVGRGEDTVEIALECRELRPWIDQAKTGETAPLKEPPTGPTCG